MMPIWTPGYYVVEDYAGRVRDLTVKAADGAVLSVSKPTGNRWTVETRARRTSACRTPWSRRDGR